MPDRDNIFDWYENRRDEEVTFTPEETEELWFTPEESEEVTFTPEESEAGALLQEWQAPWETDEGGTVTQMEPNIFDDVTGQDRPVGDWQPPWEVEKDPDMATDVLFDYGQGRVPVAVPQVLEPSPNFKAVEDPETISIELPWETEASGDTVGADVLSRVEDPPIYEYLNESDAGVEAAEQPYEGLLEVDPDMVGADRLPGGEKTRVDKYAEMDFVTRARQLAEDRAQLEEEKRQFGAKRLLEEGVKYDAELRQLYTDAQIQKQSADIANQKVMSEITDLQQRMKDVTIENWFEKGGLGRRVGAAVSAMIGGYFQALHGGPNYGAQAIDDAIEQGLNAEMASLSGQVSLAQEKRSVLKDMLAQSDNLQRTRHSIAMQTYQRVKENILAEMAMLDPRGSMFLEKQEAALQVESKIAEHAAKAIENERKRQLEIAKLEQQERESVRVAATARRGQNVTQRGQDLDFLKDRVNAAATAAGKFAENRMQNYQAGVYAVDKEGNRKEVYTVPRDEQQKAIAKSLAGRNLIQKSIRRLKSLINQPGGEVEYWDSLQEAERAELATQYGKVKNMLQMTQQEIDLAYQSGGRPLQKLIGELRKNPKALDRLSKVADDEVMEALRTGVQPGYEDMRFEFDDRLLTPQGEEGFATPPRLDTKDDLIGGEPWWRSEDEKSQITGILMIHKHFPKTNNKGWLSHLEYGTTVQSKVVKSVAARALGEHGDAGSVPLLERLVNTDDSERVRDEAKKAIDKIRKRFPNDFAPPKPVNKAVTPGPSPTGNVGGSISVPTLTPEESIEIINKTRVR